MQVMLSDQRKLPDFSELKVTNHMNREAIQQVCKQQLPLPPCKECPAVQYVVMANMVWCGDSFLEWHAVFCDMVCCIG